MTLFRGFARLLLALALFAGAGQGSASPIYSVAIDTSSLGSGQAYLGLYFQGLGSAAPATATVSDLAGAFDGTAQLTGDVTGGVPGPIVFGNGGDFVHGITLGGLITFDVAFDYGAGGDGLTFGWALFDATQYLGAEGDLGTLSIQPGALPGQQIVLAQFSPVSTVNAVPEPASIMLMILGLGLLAMWRHATR